MPDFKQALKDFVATSNSGKYKNDTELLSKFPEFKGLDAQVLKDYVATTNSGKYKTEDEVLAKFPEFKSYVGKQEPKPKQNISTLSSNQQPFDITKNKPVQEQPKLINQKPITLGNGAQTNLGYRDTGLNQAFNENINGRYASPVQIAESEKLKKIQSVYQGDQKEIKRAQSQDIDINGKIVQGYSDEDLKGNKAGYLYNKVLEGIGQIGSGLGDIVVQVASSAQPRNDLGVPRDRFSQATPLTKEQEDFRNSEIKSYREATAPSIRAYLKEKVGATVDKRLENKYNGETFTGALGGLASSLPAIGATIISGGFGTVGMGAQMFDNAIESINSTEEGRNLDEGTKTFFAGGVAIAQTLLEKYSLNKILKSESGLVSDLVTKQALKNAIKATDGKVTGDIFTKFLDKEVLNLSNKFAIGGARTLDAVLLEYGTEFAQEGATITGELLVNKSSGKPVFDTKDVNSWNGFLSNIQRANKAGVAGAIGGGLLGSISALANVNRNKIEQNDQVISEIDKNLENENLSDITRELLVQNKIKLQTEQQGYADKIDQIYDKLDSKSKDKVNEITEQKIKIEEAVKDPSVTEEVKKTLENQSKELDKELSEVKPPKVENVEVKPTEATAPTETKQPEYFNVYEDAVKQSKTKEEAFAKATESGQLSDTFNKKYNPDGSLTPEQTFEKFYNEVKPSVTEITTPRASEGVSEGVNEGVKITPEKQLGESTPIVEVAKLEPVTKQSDVISEEFKNKINANIESEDVVKTISNISEESLLKLDETESTLNRIHLQDALLHGEGIVESSKKEFGDKYVDGLLNYLENNKVKPYIESLAIISLENDLNRRILAEPENKLTLRKQLKRVQNISVNIQRDKARAVAFGILRRIGRVGYDVDRVTNEVFSNRQLIEKSEIENAIQAAPNQINEVALEQETLDVNNDITPEVQKIIDDSIEAEVNKIYKALPTKRRQTADRAIKKLESFQKKLRGRAYDATIGIPIQIIDSGITTIKYAIKAGVSIADAVELGIKKIKESYGKEWKNESRFRNDMLEEFKEITTQTEKSKSIKIIVKNSLIKAGYSREISVKTKNGTEKRNILDWKKLAGEEGSIDNIREAVDKSLKNEGYTQEELTSMQDSLIEEYNNLRASIIEKGLNEIARRNKVKPLTDPKSSAKRLAELYNYGLFEQDPTEYNNLINSAVGLSLTEQKMLTEAQEIAKTLADIYSYKNPKTGKPYTDLALSSQIASVNLKIEKLLSRVVRHKGSLAFKITGFINAWMGGALRAKLLSVRNAVENIQSGVTERLIDKVSNIFKETSKSSKLLNRAQREQALNIFLDSTFNVGTEYGGIGSPFVSKNEIEDFINKGSKNKVYHAIISTVMGKTYLEGTDSFNKVILTEKQFNRNLLKILTSPTNPKRMTADEGLAYITEATTGLSLREAYINAKDLVETVNKKAGKEMIPNNQQSLNRLASGMVKDALVNGQAFTKEQVRAAFEAAYTTAGHGLGHEANNPISRALKDVNGRMELSLKRAVKEENWAEATVWQTGLIINKNILSPFVGGGTNWVNLALQKMGMPIAPLLQPEFFAKNKGIDVTTVEGIRNLKNSLELDGTRKKAFARTFIGAMTSLTIYALAKASGADDDIYEFMKKNPYLKKFFDKIAPPVLVAMMYAKDDKLGDFWEKILNQRSETITDSYKLSKAIGKTINGVSKGNEKDKIDGLGEIGAIIGDKFTIPFAPIGVYTDVMTVFDGINGIEPKKVDKKARGFWNGWFKTGIAKEFGLRPAPTTTRQLVYEKPYEIEVGSDNNKKIIKLNENQLEKRISYANEYINKFGKRRESFLLKKYLKNNKEDLGLIEIHEKVDRALERAAMKYSRGKIMSDINSGRIKVDKNVITDK